MSPQVTHDELVEDLVKLVTSRLVDPLEIVLETPSESREISSLRATVLRQAERWAQQLRRGSEDEVNAVVARLLAALYPGDPAWDPPTEWWRRPLGRVTASRLGHPLRAHVPYATAGAMLGITRQGVHDLVNRGKLHRHPDGGIDTSSVRERLSSTHVTEGA